MKLHLRENGVGAVSWPGSELPLEVLQKKKAFPITNYLNDHLVMIPTHQSLGMGDIVKTMKLIESGLKSN